MRYLGTAAALGATLLAGTVMQCAGAVEGLPPGVILQPTPVKPLTIRDVTQDHSGDIRAIVQVFHAYIFYHDTHDGDNLAKLFVPDGVFEDLYNNTANGTLDPTKGIGGLGCLMRGREQIAKYIIQSGGNVVLNFPGHSHHMPTSEIVTITDDGDTATLTANFMVVSTNDTTGAVTPGLTADYLIDFKRTHEGWQIVRNLPINDHPGSSTSCDLNGPLPR